MLLGAALTKAPSLALIGTLAVLLAAGAFVIRPALGVAVLTFTYPFDLTTHAGPVKLTTSTALIGILLLAWLVRELLLASPQWRTTPLDVPVLLFAGATGLSLLGLNGHLDEQLVGLLKALGGFLVFFVVTQSVRSRSDLWLVLGSVVATALVQASVLSLPVLNGTHLVSEASRVTGTMVQPNLFAGYLILVLPVLVAIGVAFRPSWPTALTALATFVLSVALVATLSRSAWMGLLAATGVLVWSLPGRRRRVAAVVGAVAAVLLIAGLMGPIGARLSPHASGPLVMLLDRWRVWRVAVAMTIDHPLFGIGVANFQNFYTGYSGHRFGLNHAHNLFLNIAAERGIPALLAFGALVFSLFKLLASRIRLAESIWNRALVVGLVASFAAYFVHSLFEVSYYDYKVLLLFWLLMGLAASLPRVLASRATEAIRREEVAV